MTIDVLAALVYVQCTTDARRISFHVSWYFPNVRSARERFDHARWLCAGNATWQFGPACDIIMSYYYVVLHADVMYPNSNPNASARSGVALPRSQYYLPWNTWTTRLFAIGRVYFSCTLFTEKIYCLESSSSSFSFRTTTRNTRSTNTFYLNTEVTNYATIANYMQTVNELKTHLFVSPNVVD